MATTLKRKLTEDSAEEQTKTTVQAPVTADKPKPAKMPKVANKKGKAAEKKTKSTPANTEYQKEEMTLIEMTGVIKSVLGREHPNAIGCIELLQHFGNLNITPLMLVKYPECVNIIKRCRRYVGNVASWGLSEEEAEEFKEQAQKIRILAEEIYQQIKKLFIIPEGMPFWTRFNELADELAEYTKDMTPKEIANLQEPPECIMDSLLVLKND